MQEVAPNTMSNRQSSLMALIIIATCLFLFYLDHETKSILDVFSIEMVVPLIVYFIPTYVVCLLLAKLFNKRLSAGNSLALSLLIGIPVSFAIIMLVLMWKLKG